MTETAEHQGLNSKSFECVVSQALVGSDRVSLLLGHRDAPAQCVRHNLATGPHIFAERAFLFLWYPGA
jgi:hypothetical protein